MSTQFGIDFEHYCAKILEDSGYSFVEVTQASGDQGIDVLATKDGVTYAVQCKCYSGNVGNSAVQEAFAGKSFYNCDKAMVMTNADFTESAVELAEATGVILWGKIPYSLGAPAYMQILKEKELKSQERKKEIQRIKDSVKQYLEKPNKHGGHQEDNINAAIGRNIMSVIAEEENSGSNTNSAAYALGKRIGEGLFGKKKK